MNKTVNVGLIGYGVAGQVFHAPMVYSVSGLKLYKIYDSREESKGKINSKFEDVLFTTNIDEIYNDKNIDLVIVATPNIAHYELAKRALVAGKNVLVEKPFTVTSEEADKLIQLAKEKNKLLTVHHNRRWDSDFKTIKRVINGGLLGELAEYEAHYDRFRNFFKENAWREQNAPGSGILYDLGSHLIDQAQDLFGIPDEIFGDLNIQRKGGETIDNFEVILKYPNLKVTLKAGMLVKEDSPHFVLYGNKGSFVKYGMDVQEGNLRKDLIPKYTEEWGKESQELWGTLNTELNGLNFRGKVESENGDYRALYENVYKAIIGEEELIVKPQEARNTIRIIELAEESNNKKAWVKFS
ncbi:Gfo/Idh/MocA family oxidoreductase [Clostridium sp. 'White wine YQ']|uniref:Gfo/Idh/MocA family oxidoreductase n=1 Tax=Clostridium sp. 'White wine YQ' TaxID=3027474 RepID=UPI002366755E|nr:Gfo/Idh/MocA family oxidoreductase [Clostridium sp. 'White wine YQ']MDD7795712.1 Gfo/Idh/MocA family oxidoreductase [Clostridium sp. 'White wine YQ']